jgi:rod shape determining protein RodA
MGKIFFRLKNLDWVMFSAALLLACFGLTEIYSIALGQGGTDLLNFKKQIFFVLAGLFVFFVLVLVDYDFLKNSVKYFYIIAFVALVVVIFVGHGIRGTRGWFSIGFFNLQPVEFAKIVLILALSYFLSSRAVKIRSFKQLIVSGVITAGLAMPTFMQPDFGSASLLLVTWVALLLFSGFNKKFFVVIAIILAVAASSLWLFYFKDYQKERIKTFIDPSANALSTGYNVNQALIAIGSGGVWGRGVGFGSQSQLKFLPEAHTDFIFAVVSEEFGFLGGLLILLAFMTIFYRALSSIGKISNDFGIFIVLGGMGLIFIEMFINISMNLGIMPVVGIALPFVSYGGSSMIASFALLGIIENIIIKAKTNF